MSLMGIEHVFNDGKTQAGAASSAGSVASDTVKAFSNSGDVPMWNTDAGVFDAEDRLVTDEFPFDSDFAAGRCVLYSIGDQVLKRASEVCFDPTDF